MTSTEPTRPRRAAEPAAGDAAPIASSPELAGVSTHDRDTAPLATLPASLLQNEVARIAVSASFRSSPRHQRFLEHLVMHALRADGSRMKEMTLGIEVFDRDAGTFDPQQDSIVRVEARRLRSRLERYYGAEGARSPFEIVLPVGGYTPMLRRRRTGQDASLAVLPIVDRTASVAIVPAFCDDLFEALIDAVARIPGFKVIARTSAMRVHETTGPETDDPANAVLARRLGVALLLHGTVDSGDGKLRLRLRLVRGAADERLWSATWTFAIDSDFDARDRLVAAIVAHVQDALLASVTGERTVVERPTSNEPVHAVDERARDLVDRGRYLMRHGPVDAYPQALQRFRDAAAIAPGYAAAHFGIARSLSYLLGMTQVAPRDGVDEARAAASRALALDPSHGDAASILAGLQQRFDHDWAAAQVGYLSAIALAPGSLYVHSNYAFGLMFSGRFDEAGAELRLARELDPLDLGQRATQALLRIYTRDDAGAARVLDALLDDEPRHLLGRSLRGALHLFGGRPDEALAEYRIAERLAPDISIGSVGVAQAHALAGRIDDARAARAELVDRFEGRYLSPYQLALIDLRLGDVDSAFDELRRSARERDPNFIAVLVDPSLDALRDDPRFAALLVDRGLDAVLPGD